MRSALLLAALLAASACSGEDGEEVVRGFHGYAWGTPVAQIPEVAGTEQVGDKDGLHIYSADLTYRGRPVLAGFYFHPKTGGLVEGYYVYPITLEECESEWKSVVADLEQSFPTLTKEEHVARRAASDSTRYVSDCELYLFNSETQQWNATLINPDAPGDRAGAWINVIGRSLRMTVFYQGGAGHAWEERFRLPQIFRRQPPAPRPEEAPQQPRPGSEGLPIGRA